MEHHRLGGVISALVTPCDPDGSLDETGLDAVLDFQAMHGVQGVFILGTAGQGPMLSPDERKQIATRVLQRVKGLLRVIVHVGAMPTRVAADLAQHAADAGADALASVPPTYYRHDWAGIRAYYTALVEVSPLPLLVYNNPQSTGVSLSPEQVAELVHGCGVAGVKDAGGSLGQFCDARARCPEGLFYIANANLNLAALTLGATGAISTISTVLPEPFLALQAALVSRDLDTARRWQEQINTLAAFLRVPTISMLHEALRLRGVPAGTARSPLRRPTPGESERLRQVLEQYGYATRS